LREIELEYLANETHLALFNKPVYPTAPFWQDFLSQEHWVSMSIPHKNRTSKVWYFFPARLSVDKEYHVQILTLAVHCTYLYMCAWHISTCTTATWLAGKPWNVPIRVTLS
jgi:hypothetical protein